MILEFDGVQFSFGEHMLLSGIYVKCETGKITGLLGRNGSGKSTLLKIAFGSLSCETVSVRMDKKRIAPPAFASKQISYLPQHSFIPTNITLKKILKLYQIEESEILKPFPELEQDLILSANEVSGGRLRLFETLLILNSPTSFCFLDEPFTGLTPIFVERIKEVIQKKKTRKGILITDHLYEEVIILTDELYLLTNGKTYLTKSREDLISRGYILS